LAGLAAAHVAAKRQASNLAFAARSEARGSGADDREGNQPVMDRRVFVSGILTLLVAPPGVVAQPAERVWRIGYLSEGGAEPPFLTAFRQGLRDLGYVEGRNLVIEERYAEQRSAALPGLAAELVRLKVDVTVVRGSPAVVAAQRAHDTLPIVMTVHADPVGTGLVASLAHPGGRVTGLTDGHADLAPKRLELLKEMVASVSRVAALHNPSTPHAARQLQHIQANAPALGLTILPVKVQGPRDIDGAFGSARRERADAVFVIPDPSWSLGQERRLADLALKHRLPAIGTLRKFAETGMLMAYGTDFAHLFHRAATYVDKILKGARPGDLPIEHPTKFDLIINLRTAKALGLTIPPALLVRANDVIQ
jgi:putative ABC transport system substrate-binding protein